MSCTTADSHDYLYTPLDMSMPGFTYTIVTLSNEAASVIACSCGSIELVPSAPCRDEWLQLVAASKLLLSSVVCFETIQTGQSARFSDLSACFSAH